jgi:argininosuccinate lyase
LVSLLTTLKGLPSSYQRDLQEDKLPLFAAHDDVAAMLEIAAGAVAATEFRTERLTAVAVFDHGLLATELADALVRRGVPFRQAHDAVGKILREAEKQGRAWTELSLEDLRRFAPELDAGVRGEITIEAALARRAVPGGTAPEAVRRALEDLRRRIHDEAVRA